MKAEAEERTECKMVRPRNKFGAGCTKDDKGLRPGKKKIYPSNSLFLISIFSSSL